MRTQGRGSIRCVLALLLAWSVSDTPPALAASYTETLKEMEQVTQEMQACGMDMGCLNKASKKLNALSAQLQQLAPPSSWPSTAIPPQQAPGGAASPPAASVQSPQGMAAVPASVPAAAASSGAGTRIRLEDLRAQREQLRKPPPPTTVELIDKDAEAGAIDGDTALLYKVYGTFAAKQLPKRYRTQQPYSEGTAVLREVRRRYNTLSPRVQQALLPFVVNPLHPQSIFNQSAGGFSLLDLIPTADAAVQIPVVTNSGKLSRWKTEGGWVSLVTRNKKIKIWYKRGSGDKRIAEESKKYFDQDKIREREVGLMGVAPPNDRNLAGDDGLFDIWFYPIADYGLTYGLEDAKQIPSTIIIRRSLTGKKLAATLAHELFHAIQYNFNAEPYAETEFAGLAPAEKARRIKERKKTDEFLTESTATWAEDYVYKAGNTEQEYLDDLFSRPESSLYDTSASHEYGAYLFHFYYEQKYGPQFMHDMWIKREQGKPPLEALMQATGPDFDERFKEFCLWNWNRDPLRLYRDKGQFPKKGMKYESHPLEALNLISDITLLQPLSADYLSLTEKDSSIRKVRFDLKEFNAKKGAALWAVVKISHKTAFAEDWSDRDERVFCFDDPEEDLERITLIHLNADAKATVAGTSKVQRSRNPCSPKLELSLAIKGQDSKTERTSSGDTTLTDGSSISGEADLSVVFEERPVYPHLKQPTAPTLLVPRGSFSYDLRIKQWGTRDTLGGYYRPPLGGGIVTGQRYAEGSSGRHDLNRRVTARASWKGDKSFMTLYQSPSVTMTAVPVEGSDATEYSVNLNVDGRYQETRSSHASSGKLINGVITSEPVDESESDSGAHPVMLELNITVPKAQASVEISPEHLVSKELVFPTGDSSIVSYPQAQLTVKGTLSLFQDY